MRLFTGIAIDPAVLEKLAPLLEELKATAKLNWSRMENLHITTKFIGEWPEQKLAQLMQELRGVPKAGAVPIELRGFGFFPKPTSAKIFYMGVDGGARLPELAAQVEQACAQAGCPKENREYTPHMTLGKIRNIKTDALRARIAGMEETLLERFEAKQFHLYLSRPSPEGSIYTKLADFPLT